MRERQTPGLGLTGPGCLGGERQSKCFSDGLAGAATYFGGGRQPGMSLASGHVGSAACDVTLGKRLGTSMPQFP